MRTHLDYFLSVVIVTLSTHTRKLVGWDLTVISSQLVC